MLHRGHRRNPQLLQTTLQCKVEMVPWAPMDPITANDRQRTLGDPGDHILSNCRPLQMRRLLRSGRMAAASLFTCAPLFFARRPRTPLRVLCIGAFDYAARLEGHRLDWSRRKALACACDFGALRNDFYDQRKLNPGMYRQLRRSIAQLAPQTVTRRYIHELRRAERGRPIFRPGGFEEPEAVVEYRNRVLSVSLGWLQAISRRSLQPAMFEALLALVALVQLVDDLLDWKDDWASRRPTYVTAFLREWTPPSRPPGNRLHAYANELWRFLVQASGRRVEIAPLMLAGGIVWVMAIVILRLRLPE